MSQWSVLDMPDRPGGNQQRQCEAQWAACGVCFCNHLQRTMDQYNWVQKILNIAKSRVRPAQLGISINVCNTHWVSALESVPDQSHALEFFENVYCIFFIIQGIAQPIKQPLSVTLASLFLRLARFSPICHAAGPQ